MLRLEIVIYLSVIFFISIINRTGSELAKERFHKLEKQELSPKRSWTQYRNYMGEWSSWSSCNRKCTRRRVRYCLQPRFCDKKIEKQSKRCMRRGKRCSFTPRKIRKDKAKQMEETVYELLYGEWSPWSVCTRSCKKRRYRSCVNKSVCKGTILMEHRFCSAANTKCKTLYEKNKEKNKNEVEKKKKNESDSNNSKKVFPDKSNSNSSGNNSSNSGLQVKGCGIRNITATTRIIGGQESRQGSWPWQVAILTQWKEQYCGGVMITPEWVLTAAHCLRRRMRKVILRIGEHDFHVEEGIEQDFKINKQAAKLHPKFSMKDIDSDIALVKLKEPIKNKDSIGYACVPESDDILPEKTLCYVVGWGKMKETHLFGTDVLREVAVPLVNNNKCQEAFDFRITQNQMCAGYKKGGRDTCAGDSGGPLMCEITKKGVKRWYVYGVTSFGEGCGDKGKYGIYTDVKNFHEWIKKTIK